MRTGVPAGTGATVTVGKIERYPGGTAVVTSDYVLQSISCEGGRSVASATTGRGTDM